MHAVFIGARRRLRRRWSRSPRELGLDDRVEFTGRVPDEDLLRYLSTADVCLSPDPRNPLNDVSTMNKIMEYMAMARPIVSFDLREARVSAGDAAVYAPANDESRVRQADRASCSTTRSERAPHGRARPERVERAALVGALAASRCSPPTRRCLARGGALRSAGRKQL